MNDNIEAYDALDNPIIIGELYGISRNSNGITTITIGRAKNLSSNGKVTVTVVEHKRALWENRAEVRKLQRKSVNYLSSALFPVDEKKIK